MRVSAKHGLNPSLVTCFWCGEGTGEIVMFGASYPKGAEAPMHSVMNYEPCADCRDKFSLGIVLMEAQTRPIKDRPEIQEGVWPTGAHVVITENDLRRAFDPATADSVIKAGKAFIDTATFTQLFRGSQCDG